jgi:alpha-beta hydrolase superfamily lysophospholipase
VKLERKDVRSSKMLSLTSYRFPAQDECKGTVQFIHGYGDYTGQYAYFAQKFA